MKNIINSISIPIAGLMLALAATGNLLASYGEIYKNSFGTISGLILSLLLIKIFINPGSFVNGLGNHVIASVTPTSSMGIMILSTYMKPLSQDLAYGLWITGLILHCVLIIYFTKKFILVFNIKQILPSYFVVYVGIVVGSVTAPAYNALNVGQWLFWFGFSLYFLLLPVVLYRVFVVKSIPEPALPTITIFAAPASLCLAGYLSSFPQKNMTIIWILTSLSLVMLISVLIYMPKMLKLKFYPSYSAFTFPLVISAIAIKKVNGFLITIGQEAPLFIYITKVQELLAASIVIYVLVRYIHFICTDKLNHNPLEIVKPSK